MPEKKSYEKNNWPFVNSLVFSVFQQVNKQRKAIVQLILEKRELLVGHRVKRDGTSAVIYC